MADIAARTDRRNWRPLAIVAGAAGLLIAVTVALWAHYGTALFYELVLAGLALCL